jgi:hypothetical protein
MTAAGACGLAGCIQTSETERTLGQTYVGQSRESKLHDPFRTGGNTTELRFQEITTNYVFSSSTSIDIENIGNANISRKYAAYIFSCDQALDGSFQRIRLDKNRLNPYMETPDPSNVYRSWFEFAELIVSEGEPVVGVSLALTQQLSQLNQAVARSINQTRKSFNRNLPPDILQLINVLIEILRQTDQGQNVQEVVNSANEVEQSLENILELIPELYDSSSDFINGSDQSHGIPVFLRLLKSDDPVIDYRYVMEYVFGGSPGELLVAPYPDGIEPVSRDQTASLQAIGGQGSLSIMAVFHDSITSFYEEIKQLASDLDGLANALTDLPGGATPLVQKISSLMTALSTLLKAGAQAADELYLWSISWCFQNLSQVYSDMNNHFDRIQSKGSL